MSGMSGYFVSSVTEIFAKHLPFPFLKQVCCFKINFSNEVHLRNHLLRRLWTTQPTDNTWFSSSETNKIIRYRSYHNWLAKPVVIEFTDVKYARCKLQLNVIHSSWRYESRPNLYVYTCICNNLMMSEATYFVWNSDDDVLKWKRFLRYWPFVQETHRSPVNSPHKGQWGGALMFYLICAWTHD